MIVYLDQNVWVGLREAQANRSQSYCPLLEHLRKGVESGLLLVPISAPHYYELIYQEDAVTRTATAQIMDEISRGLGLLSMDEIMRDEMLDHFELSPNPRQPWICSSCVDPAGRDRLPVTFAEPTVAIEHCSDDRKWIESLVQGSTSTGRFLSSSQQDLTYSLLSLKADDPTSNYRSALRLHKHEFCSTVRCLVTKIFSELEALLPPAWQKSISSLRRDESTRTLPFLNAFSAVHALFRLDGNRNYGRGDGYDAQHAAFGLAYFDVLLVDKSLGHLLRTGPLHLDTLFNVRVARSPADAIRLMNESR